MRLSLNETHFMKTSLVFTLLLLCLVACQKNANSSSENIVTADIANFWEAYDLISSTQDTTLQYKYLDSLFLQKGTAGLKGIIQARNYTAADYINAIHNYPKFWASIRNNTLRTDEFVVELNAGIEKIRVLYPELKPAKIYFTIGALLTGGTYLDSLVLIGSEIAMGDKNTETSEFPEETRAGRRAYFDSNPINDLVLLNVHEYVHTQQNELVHNLLSYCLHEGIAEFVSTTAMGVPSAVPAISFGKQNDQVRKKFEQEMFYGNNVSQWLWSDAPNEFGVRDLGYYIGYQMSELYYLQATDKQAAIKTLIELDYTNEVEIENFVNQTGFFSDSLEALYQNFDNRLPTVVDIKPFKNNAQTVDPNVQEITIHFSEPLNGYNTGVDYGPLGEAYFPPMSPDRVWSEDRKSWTIKVTLEPNKHYQFLISNNFRLENSTPLKPYLVEFKTAGN
jgi:hypothetical protein